MADLDELIERVKRLSRELDKRSRKHHELESFVEGEAPIPDLVNEVRLTKLYRQLMPVADAPWGSLIVDSKLDRLEVIGFSDPDNPDAAERIWGEAWHANEMDEESKLAHGAALLDGRCYATVWPYAGDTPVTEFGRDVTPDIALDDMTQMVVEFAPGSRRRRVAALRRWQEGDRVFATLYRPEGIYKFQTPPGTGSTQAIETWEVREVEGEPWPLPNPFGEVPVVEIAVNRRLKPGPFPYARGEFAHCIGLIQRIHLLTFLGLVVAVWMGFPMRGVIGEKIRREVLKDDEGKPIIDEATGKPKTQAVPPVDFQPGSLAQFENPQAKVFEWGAADRSHLSIYDELQQLAVVTKTPRHYFPMEGGISNIATETVNAYEGAMHAAVAGHKASLGNGWEEVLRLAGKVMQVETSPRAHMEWADHETRTLAERADAAAKLKDVLPWVAVAELALNASAEQVAHWQTLEASNPLTQLAAALENRERPSAPETEPEAVSGGAGAD